ncbi:MAG: hypothetical protein ACRCX8_08730 [Sarcina sp.]
MKEVRYEDLTSFYNSHHTVFVNEKEYDELMRADASGIINIIWEED